MYVFAGFCLLGVFLGSIMIPSELNQTATDEEVAELELLEEEADEMEGNENKPKRIEIGWCTLLSQKESFFAIMAVFCGTYNIMFW